MDGTGVNVYIIDTGVSPDHVDFGGVGGRCEMSYDAVGGIVSKLRLNLKLFKQIIPAHILPTSHRLDLFLYNEKAKKAIIAELTVPFEPNIPKAYEIKQSRYAGLLSDLNRAGVNTSLVCFEIGSRGLITQDNEARLRSILKFKGVSFKKQISRDISKLALLGSYAIWNSRKEAVWDNISCFKINGA